MRLAARRGTSTAAPPARKACRSRTPAIATPGPARLVRESIDTPRGANGASQGLRASVGGAPVVGEHFGRPVGLVDRSAGTHLREVGGEALGGLQGADDRFAERTELSCGWRGVTSSFVPSARPVGPSSGPVPRDVSRSAYPVPGSVRRL